MLLQKFARYLAPIALSGMLIFNSCSREQQAEIYKHEGIQPNPPANPHGFDSETRIRYKFEKNGETFYVHITKSFCYNDPINPRFHISLDWPGCFIMAYEPSNSYEQLTDGIIDEIRILYGTCRKKEWATNAVRGEEYMHRKSLGYHVASEEDASGFENLVMEALRAAPDNAKPELEVFQKK